MEKEIDKVYKKIIKIYNSSVQSLDEITLNIIDFYYSRYKYIDIELDTHMFKEPPKILKTRLKKWQDRKEYLEKEKQRLLEKIMEEIKELKK